MPFCGNCGVPFPWASRRERAERMMHLLGDLAELEARESSAPDPAPSPDSAPSPGPATAGEPDFATPDYVVEAAVEACRDPKNHRYTPAGGLPELKKAINSPLQRDGWPMMMRL